jgi:hypothetical protein
VLCNRCGARGVARGSNPGYPDLTMARGNIVIFAELKRMGQRATPAQTEWLDVLDGVDTVVAGLWTPDRLDELLEIMRHG